MIRIPIEWLEFAFECFESLSNASNLHSIDSNPSRMVRICIRMLRIPFEWLEFAFECFESLSNGSNFHSNASNPFKNGSNLHSNDSNPYRMVRICIRMLRIPFEWLEFAFD